jgi:hypothetical protein
MQEYLCDDGDSELWCNDCPPVEEFLRTERELSAFSRASESFESMRWIHVLEQEFQHQFQMARRSSDTPHVSR